MQIPSMVLIWIVVNLFFMDLFFMIVLIYSKTKLQKYLKKITSTFVDNGVTNTFSTNKTHTHLTRSKP